MKIKEVYCKINNTIMTVQEVAEHEKHDTIKHALTCSTPGCEANISFVSGSAGRHDHFRKIKYEEHSSACYIQTNEKELKEKIEFTEKVAVSLNEKAVQQRVMYFFNKRTQNSEKNLTGKRYSKRNKTESTNFVLGQSTELGGNEAPLLDDLKKAKRTFGPRVVPRLLNQVSEADEGKYIHLSASIENVRRTKKGFELNLYLGTSKAVLVITEAFIKGSRDTQVLDYFRGLMEFINNNKKEFKFNVSVYVFCRFNTYKKHETIIFADSFDKFYLSISGKQPRPIKLDSFQVGLIRGSWK